MWANYYPHCSIPSIFDNEVRATSSKKSYPATVMTIPVAVIPLDDPDALIRAATNAYFSSLERNTEDRWRDTLAAIGVLPRKGIRE